MQFSVEEDLPANGDKGRKLDDQELTVYRSYVGQLLRFARSTMPDIFFKTIKLARSTSSPTVMDYVEAQKLIGELADLQGEINFPQYDSIESVVPLCYVGASFANEADKSVSTSWQFQKRWLKTPCQVTSPGLCR